MMEKRIIAFFIITSLLIITYTYLISKYYPPPSQNMMENQIEKKSQEELILPAEPTPPPNKIIKERLQDVELDRFIVTLSLTGGYIKNILLKEYNEALNFHDIGLLPEFRDKEFRLKEYNNKRIIVEEPRSKIQKIWEFQDYIIKFAIQLPIKTEVKLTFFTYTLPKEMLSRRYQEVFYKKKGDNLLQRVFPSKPPSLDKKGALQLLGIRGRYFCWVFLPANYQGINSQKLDNNTIEIFTNLNQGKYLWNFYVGPQLIKELKQYNIEEIIYYGFFHIIGVIIRNILYWLNIIAHNWGVSVFLLSIIIYFILFPFTARSMRSMRKMQEKLQELQPKLEKIKKEYHDNPQKMQKETMELYKKYNINPLGGCLPMLLQFPVFIALYQVLLRFVELKGAQLFWIKDISLPDHTFMLPFTLPYFGNFINILPILIIVVNLLQYKYASPHISTNPQQQTSSTIMTLFIGAIFYHFPAALNIYWLTQNILNALYQFRLKKTQLHAS